MKRIANSLELSELLQEFIDMVTTISDLDHIGIELLWCSSNGSEPVILNEGGAMLHDGYIELEFVNLEYLERKYGYEYLMFWKAVNRIFDANLRFDKYHVLTGDLIFSTLHEIGHFATTFKCMDEYFGGEAEYFMWLDDMLYSLPDGMGTRDRFVVYAVSECEKQATEWAINFYKENTLIIEMYLEAFEPFFKPVGDKFLGEKVRGV